MAPTEETQAHLRNQLRAIFEVVAPKLDYLAARWADEKEYEDFADYAAEMQKCFPTDKDFVFVKATQRPLAFWLHTQS